MLTVTADCWQEEFHSENCWKIAAEKTVGWVDRCWKIVAEKTVEKTVDGVVRSVVETTGYQSCYQTLNYYLKVAECSEAVEWVEIVDWVESCCRRTAGCFAV